MVEAEGIEPLPRILKRETVPIQKQSKRELIAYTPTRCRAHHLASLNRSRHFPNILKTQFYTKSMQLVCNKHVAFFRQTYRSWSKHGHVCKRRSAK
jgi:hypothetical protein